MIAQIGEPKVRNRDLTCGEKGQLESENPRTETEIFSAEQKANSIASWEKLILLTVQDGLVTTLHHNREEHHVEVGRVKCIRVALAVSREMLLLSCCKIALCNLDNERGGSLCAIRVVIGSAYCECFTGFGCSVSVTRAFACQGCFHCCHLLVQSEDGEVRVRLSEVPMQVIWPSKVGTGEPSVRKRNLKCQAKAQLDRLLRQTCFTNRARQRHHIDNSQLMEHFSCLFDAQNISTMLFK